jgi:hypothetical protein
MENNNLKKIIYILIFLVILIYFLENNYNNINLSINLLAIFKIFRRRNSTCSTCYRNSQISERNFDNSNKDFNNKTLENNNLESEVFNTTDDESNFIPNIIENLRNNNRYKKVDETEALMLRYILNSKVNLVKENTEEIKKARRFKGITAEEQKILKTIFNSTIPILFLSKNTIK